MSEIQLVNYEKYNKKVKKLYKEAFPINERLPIFILKILSKKRKANFYEIYDNTSFIGMLYNVYYKDIVFVLYLAIDNQFRGKGYGSKVLNLIKEKYDKNRIILNIEKINEKAQQQKPSAKAYATAPISSAAAAMKAKLKQQQQIQQAPVVMSLPAQMPAPAYSFEQILNSLSEIETNLTDKISELLEKKLDEKLDGMDEVVVELVRCKTENETLRYKINELNKEVYNIKNELSLYKPIGLGFYVKKSVDSSLL